MEGVAGVEQAAVTGAVVEVQDEEWVWPGDLYDSPVHHGVKGTIPRRDIVDAILWVAWTGCQWRHLPAGFPEPVREAARRADVIAGTGDGLRACQSAIEREPAQLVT
jgi:transposase